MIFQQQLKKLSKLNIDKNEEASTYLCAKCHSKIAKYVKPRHNNSVHEIVRNYQIGLFTTPSQTTTNDLSEMDLKLKMLKRMHQNKSHKTHNTHQKLYNTLYEYITLDQYALDAQDAKPSFHKRTHDDQVPPNYHKRETKKKRRKDVGQPSSRSSKKDKAPITRPNSGWFTKKSRSADAANKRTTWFHLLLKSDINQNEAHILGPSTIAIAKKLKELIQKYELTIVYLEGASLEKLKKQYKNDVELKYHGDQLKAYVLTEAQFNSGKGDVSMPISFERHMSKSRKPHRSFYNNDFYYLVNLSTGEKYTTSLTKHYAARKMEDKTSSRQRSITGYQTRRSDKKEYEFSYADLPSLSLNDIKDMYLLKNRVDDLQLGVESYQRTLNLTKPKFDFDGIDEKIPCTMSGIEKGVVYLNQHNFISLMKLDKVHKLCNGTLLKIRDNLLEMVNKNVLGRGNQRLKSRDWSTKDIKKSNEMQDKIDQTLKRREQLRRFGEYVGGRCKKIDPCFFVRP
ncbi:hypothetical protein Tco_1187401 [Tanacetum coccineum]